MKKVIAGTAALVWALAAIPGAGAAELSLTLDEALALAEKASPLVVRAQAARAVAASLRVGAGVLLPSNPLVGVSVGAYRVAEQKVGNFAVQGGVGVQWGVHLEQAIEIGGQRGLRLVEADRAARAAEWRARFALVETRARTRLAYLSALLADKLVEAEQRRSEAAAQLLDVVRARVRAGAATDVDLTLAEAEYGRTNASRIEAETEREARLAELRTLVGAPQTDALRLTSMLGAPEGAVPELPRLLDAALGRRADLLALRTEGDWIDATIRRLRRERVPNPAFFVDVLSQPEVPDQPAQLYAGGGVTFALPFARRNQGELATARADRARLDAEAGLGERQVAEEVAVARAEVVRRRAQLALFDEAIVPAATRQAALLREGWRAGKFDLFRVITAVRDEAVARREQLGALGALWRAAITLDRATGAL